jgi:hypothetical protein
MPHINSLAADASPDLQQTMQTCRNDTVAMPLESEHLAFGEKHLKRQALFAKSKM